jgi:hypothetical protein
MAGSRQRRSSPPAPKIDRGFDRPPHQDDHRDDRAPSDYEREIDRLDAAARSEH